MSSSTVTRYDRRMHALMNDRRAAALYATAARRRVLVGMHIALSAAGVGLGFVLPFGERPWVLFALIGLLVPWCVATGAINGATRGLLELRGRMLDERQLAERDRVHARAHRLTTGMLAATGLGTALLGWAGAFRFETLVAPVLLAALAVHWLMPLWVAGLGVRDEPADDEF